MRKLTGALALCAAVAISPTTGAMTTDGDWSDWFSYSGNVASNNWDETLVSLNSAGTRALNDEEGPTPGRGGQAYDIEQIFYMYEDADANALTGGVLRIGLVTGFPAEGVSVDDLYAGDMFIDFGNSGDFDVAVATSTSNDNVEVPGGVDSDYFGNNYLNDGTSNWIVREPTLFPEIATPWRVNRNQSIENLLNSSVAWGRMGAHSFLEIAVEIDGGLEDIISNPLGGVGLHWTMECGNDVIRVQDNLPLVAGTNPIPEPSTLILLGMGAMGVALRTRFTA